MPVYSCEECKAIYREMLELVELSRRSKSSLPATQHQWVEYLDRWDASQDYRMRIIPGISSVIRRLKEHQKLTGHILPWALPPGGLNSPN